MCTQPCHPVLKGVSLHMPTETLPVGESHRVGKNDCNTAFLLSAWKVGQRGLIN